MCSREYIEAGPGKSVTRDEVSVSVFQGYSSAKTENGMGAHGRPSEESDSLPCRVENKTQWEGREARIGTRTGKSCRICLHRNCAGVLAAITVPVPTGPALSVTPTVHSSLPIVDSAQGYSY